MSCNTGVAHGSLGLRLILSVFNITVLGPYGQTKILHNSF